MVSRAKMSGGSTAATSSMQVGVLLLERRDVDAPVVQAADGDVQQDVGPHDVAAGEAVVPGRAQTHGLERTVQRVVHELVGEGRVVGSSAQSRQLLALAAQHVLVRPPQLARGLGIVVRGLARQVQQVGVESAQPVVADHPPEQMDRQVVLAGQPRLDDAHRDVQGLAVGGGEQVALGGVVAVEHLRGDAELRDDVGDARLPVAVAGELARRRPEDGAARLFALPRDEVLAVLARGVHAGPELLANGPDIQAVLLEPPDLVEQLDVVVRVDGARRAGLLSRRQQTRAHVVVDRAAGHPGFSLELPDGQCSHPPPWQTSRPYSTQLLYSSSCCVSHYSDNRGEDKGQSSGSMMSHAVCPGGVRGASDRPRAR